MEDNFDCYNLYVANSETRISGFVLNEKNYVNLHLLLSSSLLIDKKEQIELVINSSDHINNFIAVIVKCFENDQSKLEPYFNFFVDYLQTTKQYFNPFEICDVLKRIKIKENTMVYKKLLSIADKDTIYFNNEYTFVHAPTPIDLIQDGMSDTYIEYFIQFKIKINEYAKEKIWYGILKYNLVKTYVWLEDQLFKKELLVDDIKQTGKTLQCGKILQTINNDIISEVFPLIVYAVILNHLELADKLMVKLEQTNIGDFNRDRHAHKETGFFHDVGLFWSSRACRGILSAERILRLKAQNDRENFKGEELAFPHSPTPPRVTAGKLSLVCVAPGGNDVYVRALRLDCFLRQHRHRLAIDSD